MQLKIRLKKIQRRSLYYTHKNRLIDERSELNCSSTDQYITNQLAKGVWNKLTGNLCSAGLRFGWFNRTQFCGCPIKNTCHYNYQQAVETRTTTLMNIQTRLVHISHWLDSENILWSGAGNSRTKLLWIGPLAIAKFFCDPALLNVVIGASWHSAINCYDTVGDIRPLLLLNRKL